MKVRIKIPFYDDKGLHKKGDVIDVNEFSSDMMELVKEEKKTKIETAVSKTERKTAIRKKGD